MIYMSNRSWRWIRRVVALLAYVFLLQAGCLRDIQRELEILWAPEANLDSVYNSTLFDLFGPGILQFW